jgi:hypothetical protein
MYVSEPLRVSWSLGSSDLDQTGFRERKGSLGLSYQWQNQNIVYRCDVTFHIHADLYTYTQTWRSLKYIF